MPKDAAAGGKQKGVVAVEHALDVLRSFSVQEPQLGVGEIARRIGLHKSSVSRIVATLEAAQLVERDSVSGRVRLGIGLVTLAAPVLADLTIARVAHPVMEDLARYTGETVSLNVRDGVEAVCVQQARGPNEIAHYAPPGFRNPPHCTAAGKVLLAFADDIEMRRVLAGPLERFTDRTITDPNALTEELSAIRRQRVALNRGELVADVGAVAAVVRDMHGVVAGAIAATVPMYRFGLERQSELADAVRRAADEVSLRLGYSDAAARATRAAGFASSVPSTGAPR